MTKLGRPLVKSADDRRKEIFASAEKLFGEKGYEHVTMSEIATEVGMSKKTLYVHFEDKRELLKSLVMSSYIWSQDSFEPQNLTPIEELKHCLIMIAQHVLSERHIKLCRLAISESMSLDGLSQTFYEMGVSTSRKHLIEAIQKIGSNAYQLNLETEILADTLFGATIGKPFVDLLFINQHIDFELVKQHIEVVVNAMFRLSL